VSDSRLAAPGFELKRPPAVALPPRLVRGRDRDREFTLRRALLGADMVALCIALALALVLTSRRDVVFADGLWVLVTLPGWALLFRAYGLYNGPVRRFEPTHLDDLVPLFHALVIGTLGLWFFYKVMPVTRLAFEEVVVFGVASLMLVAGFRVAIRRLNLRIRGPERVFAVAPIEQVRTLNRKLSNHPEYEMALKGAITGEDSSGEDSFEELGLPLRADLDQLDSLVYSHQIDHLFVQLDAASIPQERIVELMRACHRARVHFSVFPSVPSLLPHGVEVNHLEGMGILSYRPPVLSRSSQALKRCLDVALSAASLALFAPVMALIALAIRLDSKGPILFRQARVGQDGRRFLLAKFRTMAPDTDGLVAELMEKSVDPDWLIIDDDPRVTRVGRFLRRTSLDELPQLWSVLKGEMSMVGPRPLSERDDEGVRGWGRHRLDLVPGLTGHWQVLGRTTIPFREMIEIDYAYVTNWSAWLDLKLLIRTVPAVLRRRGAI
jgi:exopolysaccharide biosynthesis polyprenyl glycosylphosphotransferase